MTTDACPATSPATFTLLQHFLYNSGTIGNHSTVYVRNGEMTPDEAALLEALHGQCSDDVTTEQHEALEALERKHGQQTMPAGAPITRLCQIFYDA